MASARATASGGFWNGDTFVSYEEGDLVTGDLATLVLSSPTLPFVDPDAPVVVELTDGDGASALEGQA